LDKSASRNQWFKSFSNDPFVQCVNQVFERSRLTLVCLKAYTLPLHFCELDSPGESMTTELRGKVAIVTGGTSGIRRDTAVLFAKAGAKVVVACRREAEGKETIDLIRGAGIQGRLVATSPPQ
jgi:hypothetical protein